MCTLGHSHPADENPDLTLPDTTRQFRQERFGIFIHWGVYNVLCDGEDVMKERNIPVQDYERLAQFFNPADFNAVEWVALAKAAGARYITFSARYHDGFAMWDSEVSDWNVVKRTPFARDVVRELARECHRENIKLFLYYSPEDWRKMGDITPAGDSLQLGESQESQTTAPVDVTYNQLLELFTKYGTIDGLWLDGFAGQPTALAQLPRYYELIRRLQPAALIGYNHGGTLMPGEDFHIRGSEFLEPSTTGNSDLQYSPVPLEVNQTLNQSRGFNLLDYQHQSPRELVHSLVRAAGVDANYLVSIGAMPDGQIPREVAERLRLVGMWLAKNGDTIYATRGGPMAPQPWGVTTHRGRKIYAHVLDPDVTTIELQLPTGIRTARYYSDELEIPFETTDDGKVTLSLRPEQPGEMQRLILLESQPYEQ